MNKLMNFAFVIVVLTFCAVGYFYVNPSHLPRAITNQVQVPGFEVPAPKSPMTGIKAPQF